MVIFTYQLPSSLSFDNYAEVEADILKQIEGHGYDEIVLDAQGMKYISSAGLRVVLNLKKKFENVSVINTSVAVYDIFEMTGFTNIVTVEKALRQVSVE
jgi:anti-anti-sigma factor